VHRPLVSRSLSSTVGVTQQRRFAYVQETVAQDRKRCPCSTDLLSLLCPCRPAGTRDRPSGRFLLRDALRAVNRASGGNSVDWSPEELMAAGDRATGTTALSKLYERFSSRGFDGGLPALFERLGVGPGQSGGVRFEPRAGLAELTRLVTLP
jgi:hypothetical protein